MVTAEVNEAPRGVSAANASTCVTLQVGEDLLDRFLKSGPPKAVEALIWNALDAEATEVVVKIEEQTEIQGLSHIQVKDNGQGCSPKSAASILATRETPGRRPDTARSVVSDRSMGGTARVGSLRLVSPRRRLGLL